MGVLNVTPDSFSDGGQFFSSSAAVARGMALIERGADLVDVGGESTRPGAARVSADEEQRRVLPVIAELAAAGVRVSVDTMRAQTAERALSAGAVVVNDVSGGLADPDIVAVAVAADVPFVVMHWRAHSAEMMAHADYGDVVSDVRDELLRRVDDVLAKGMAPARVVLDPGLGFAKNAAHNWQLVDRLAELCALGFPLLLGASRKRFLGSLLGTPESPRPVGDREVATVTVTALAAAAGAWAVRVHEPRGNRDAVDVVAAVRASRMGP